MRSSMVVSALRYISADVKNAINNYGDSRLHLKPSFLVQLSVCLHTKLWLRCVVGTQNSSRPFVAKFKLLELFSTELPHDPEAP